MISVLQSLNGAQSCVAAASGCFLWGWVPAGEPAGTAIVLVRVIIPVTKTYASE